VTSALVVSAGLPGVVPPAVLARQPTDRSGPALPAVQAAIRKGSRNSPYGWMSSVNHVVGTSRPRPWSRDFS
jgi:hypothetical protein